MKSIIERIQHFIKCGNTRSDTVIGLLHESTKVVREAEDALEQARRMLEYRRQKIEMLERALDAAPQPGTGILGAMNYMEGGMIESVHYDLYARWYDGIRKEALEC